jgi:hypothetical protein
MVSATIQPNPTHNPTRKSIREVVPGYWRRLIEVGVPIDIAKVIAIAIARYDIARKSPSAAQKALISEYSRFVCRAGLWKSQLLLTPIAAFSLMN